MMAAGGLLIFMVYQAVHRKLSPFRVWPALYSVQAMIPVALALVGLLVLTNLQDGVVYRQTYLPLLNPLEEGAAFALLGLVVFYRVSQRYFPVQLSVCRPWPVVALMALSFWWLNGLLLRVVLVWRSCVECPGAMGFAADSNLFCSVLDVSGAGGDAASDPASLAPGMAVWRGFAGDSHR